MGFNPFGMYYRRGIVSDGFGVLRTVIQFVWGFFLRNTQCHVSYQSDFFSLK